MATQYEGLTATGWSEFWGGASQYATISKDKSFVKKIARMLNHNVSTRKFREIFETLLADSTPASTASEVMKEVQSVADTNFALGGVRSIVSRTLVSRAVTATDAARLTAMLAYRTRPGTYVRDLSGNGSRGN